VQVWGGAGGARCGAAVHERGGGESTGVVEDAPAPEKMDGFDGKRAYEQVVKQVSFGPRPAGSAALGQLQNYLETELKSYGCAVETDRFRRIRRRGGWR